LVEERPVDCLEKPEGEPFTHQQNAEQGTAIILQIVQLRNEVKTGILAIAQLRTELLGLHEQARDELVRQTAETRQLILQTRQEMRVLQEHSVSRITSRLNQR
jgi:hypothetical protein